jgi:segregation and condensation protein A
MNSGAADALADALLSENAGDAEAEDVAFVVDLDGFEGPLHVLLALAREQKVDLRRLSILKLAEQYLGFIAEARARRIDLAADYLVMASWLAYLKSRLLLPRTERAKEADAPEVVAGHLAWRLARLDAMRAAGEALLARPRTGLDVHGRGAPEDVAVTEIPIWRAGLYDLLSAYASQRRRAPARVHAVKPWPVWPVDAARERLIEMLPATTDWTALGAFAPDPSRFKGEPPTPGSRYASLLAASLELAKQGRLGLRQLAMSEPVHVRRATGEGAA